MEIKGQIFSIDALFAIIVVTIVLGGLLFMSGISKGDSATYEKLRVDAQDEVTMNLYKGIYESREAGGTTTYCENYFDFETDAVMPYGWCENE